MHDQGCAHARGMLARGSLVGGVWSAGGSCVCRRIDVLSSQQCVESRCCISRALRDRGWRLVDIQMLPPVTQSLGMPPSAGKPTLTDSKSLVHLACFNGSHSMPVPRNGLHSSVFSLLVGCCLPFLACHSEPLSEATLFRNIRTPLSPFATWAVRGVNKASEPGL